MILRTLLFVLLCNISITSQASDTKQALNNIKQYVKAWAISDDQQRLAVLEKAWAKDGIFQDPTSQAKNIQELSDLIGSFGGYFVDTEVISNIDIHNGQFRFYWRLVASDGTVFEGEDFGFIGDDNKVKAIYGFSGFLRLKK